MSDSLDIFAGAITKSSSSKDQPQAKQQNQQQGQPQQQSSQQGQAPQNAQQAQPSQPAQPQNGGGQGGKKRDKFRNRGGRMTTRSISRIAKQAMREQGIDSPRLTAHSMRHTAVTLALLGGATVQETQAMARHASVTTTMRYAHNLDRAEAKAEHSVDAVLAC